VFSSNFKPVESDGAMITPPPPPPAGPTALIAPSVNGRTGTPSVIGADLVIVGNLVSKGDVQVDGEVQGDIHSVHVVIGANASLTGSIIADEVVVRGRVMGTIRSRRVRLESSGHVEGDIHHSALAIEQGAFFEGKSRRSEDPTAGIARPEIPSAVPSY
jgi:cytoskeletal protein CcmA (bactofilin family)